MIGGKTLLVKMEKGIFAQIDRLVREYDPLFFQKKGEWLELRDEKQQQYINY